METLDIALKMNKTKPSVNKAINILKTNKLINYEAYGNIELTRSGEDLAKKVLAAYDIVYLFLKDILNLNAEEAKQEAEKIKNITSDKTLNNLAKYVYKELNISKLNCPYDINREQCRSCAKIKEGKNKNE